MIDRGGLSTASAGQHRWPTSLGDPFSPGLDTLVAWLAAGREREGLRLYFAVDNLIGRYCEAVLRCDIDLFAACWLEDATWCIPGNRVVTGREAIRAVFADIRPRYRLCVQEILNRRIEPLGDAAAKATFQIRELQWRADGSGSELIGVYHDEIVASPSGVASFVRRDFELLYSGPVVLEGRLRNPRGRP